MTLMNPTGEIETYEIKMIFPFTSESKRMGIIVQNLQSKRIIFYLKGAENIMKHKVKPQQRATISEKCDLLSIEGLRTLVITQRVIEQQEFDNWMINHREASADLTNREEKVQASMEELEHEMELLGITGVEDKLQDEVPRTIQKLRQGGIQVWMLTGDKIETAQCIAISAGFKTRQ